MILLSYVAEALKNTSIFEKPISIFITFGIMTIIIISAIYKIKN